MIATISSGGWLSNPVAPYTEAPAPPYPGMAKGSAKSEKNNCTKIFLAFCLENKHCRRNVEKYTKLYNQGILEPDLRLDIPVDLTALESPKTGDFQADFSAGKDMAICIQNHKDRGSSSCNTKSTQAGSLS